MLRDRTGPTFFREIFDLPARWSEAGLAKKHIGSAPETKSLIF